MLCQARLIASSAYSSRSLLRPREGKGQGSRGPAYSVTRASAAPLEPHHSATNASPEHPGVGGRVRGYRDSSRGRQGGTLRPSAGPGVRVAATHTHTHDHAHTHTCTAAAHLSTTLDTTHWRTTAHTSGKVAAHRRYDPQHTSRHDLGSVQSPYSREGRGEGPSATCSAHAAPSTHLPRWPARGVPPPEGTPRR